MPKQPAVRIVVTNDDLKKSVIFIRKISSGWIAGFDYVKPVNVNKKDIHYTHHTDGKTHLKKFDEVSNWSNSVPLNNFHGITKLFGAILDPNIAKESLFMDFIENRKDIVIYLNSKEFVNEKCRILWDSYLLEPDKLDLLNSVHQGKPENPQIHIYKNFNPWLIVCIYKKREQ